MSQSSWGPAVRTAVGINWFLSFELGLSVCVCVCLTRLGHWKRGTGSLLKVLSRGTETDVVQSEAIIHNGTGSVWAGARIQRPVKCKSVVMSCDPANDSAA